jgi:4-hydroxy-3-polyprenylbenzoate decarboxylase
MEQARAMWESLGLPKLRPQSPWFSAPESASWPASWDEAALRAATGRYLDNGRASEKRKRKGLKPETRVKVEKRDS